jgi:hypothetical protein
MCRRPVNKGETRDHGSKALRYPQSWAAYLNILLGPYTPQPCTPVRYICLTSHDCTNKILLRLTYFGRDDLTRMNTNISKKDNSRNNMVPSATSSSFPNHTCNPGSRESVSPYSKTSVDKHSPNSVMLHNYRDMEKTPGQHL